LPILLGEQRGFCMMNTDKIHSGGPLRIAAWSTWSGRERSSHSHIPQVPQTRLASISSLCFRLSHAFDKVLHLTPAVQASSAACRVECVIDR